jgi:hypothetical protein
MPIAVRARPWFIRRQDRDDVGEDAGIAVQG